MGVLVMALLGICLLASFVPGWILWEIGETWEAMYFDGIALLFLLSLSELGKVFW